MQFMLIARVFKLVKKLTLGTIDKIHLKCDVIDGSVINGSKHSLIYIFI